MNNAGATLYPLLLTIFGLSILFEIVGGQHRWNRSTLKGSLFALTGIAAHTVVAAPIVGIVLSFVFNYLFPHSTNLLVGTAFWLAFPIYFVVEEFCHYWLHRWSHEKRWLWKLHRTHHSAAQLNTLVLYRYNIFWTALLPQAWFGAIALHLGLTEVFIAGTLITFSVNVLTHTSYRWDLALRKLPLLNPLFNVLEKIVTLPDTHHAHHGLGKNAHARGNYAVTIFLFDVLLGTAKIPRARQEKFGLPAQFDWREELFWPLVRKGIVRPPRDTGPSLNVK
jgi:sterol desaturase/sphingolipid hydroxylase (fatty acid hydroxylase superfamily)